MEARRCNTTPKGPCSYIGIMEKKMEATIMENQMEKKMENEMETGLSWGIYRGYIGIGIYAIPGLEHRYMGTPLGPFMDPVGNKKKAAELRVPRSQSCSLNSPKGVT